MSRLLITLAIALALIAGGNGLVDGFESLAHAGSKASIADIPLPPGARIQPEGSYRAAQSYRKTVVFFERYLRRQGIAHERLPTYEVRGVLVTRILSSSPSSRWLAIHVYKIGGMTHVFIVPRAAAAAAPPAANAKSASQP